eukprot:GDKH01004337.1.p3 GENE.GDKH01004337.1~~GDKH01004337.1.p3  ORF type:complete len:55 (-),score=4.65 GDKH01004337.1:44-208(-)
MCTAKKQERDSVQHAADMRSGRRPTDGKERKRRLLPASAELPPLRSTAESGRRR